ncbi:uncharacterized protein Ecym_8051 [Eremothecium cymbalariae DBVPG|uniref:Uncharacterized protein n=1 Tax=Eremothecium cymbalariae (strain CBS 270.75 / DBVPG 7215 / KCTC 17166 / NRRL Y-17582) TaxID=931890 RepID=G8JWX3_ERECY|nr:Hypothetical protein Ecym_8051 [Eremothecium cymbalariae DBVPG\
MSSFKEFLPHTVGFVLDNEDITFPSYVPTNVQSLPHTSNGIRQLVIEKQNQRVFPTYNRLLDRMEDALVRWRPPASSHVGSSLAIHGTHPYQKDFSEPKAIGKDLTESIEQMKQMFQQCWNKDSGGHGEVVEDNDDTLSDYSLPPAASGEDVSPKCRGLCFDTLSTSRRTPVAFPIRASVATPRSAPVEDIENTLNTYKFPVPSYYLPPTLQRQRQQDNHESLQLQLPGSQRQHAGAGAGAGVADLEHQSSWHTWCLFWKDFWFDLNNLLVCHIEEDLY